MAVRPSRPALRYHGSKFQLADKIISYFPSHRIYAEPFGGGAGIMLQKPPCKLEVYNDLNGDIVNFSGFSGTGKRIDKGD